MSDKYKDVSKNGLKSPLVRSFLMIGGVIAALLGFTGIFIPLLPTTPFLLLASWCFVRSSDRMNSLLLHNRYLGPYISNYKSGKGITLRNKAYSLGFLWITLSSSVIFGPPYRWLWIGLIMIGVAVTFHILKFKTLKKK
ncbi:MAG: DUF454 domain-containing protein [Lentimicrobium sp.]|nr:DUF454 domain-containing protein [Lentimicrobium sp.]